MAMGRERAIVFGKQSGFLLRDVNFPTCGVYELPASPMAIEVGVFSPLVKLPGDSSTFKHFRNV